MKGDGMKGGAYPIAALKGQPTRAPNATANMETCGGKTCGDSHALTIGDLHWAGSCLASCPTHLIAPLQPRPHDDHGGVHGEGGGEEGGGRHVHTTAAQEEEEESLGHPPSKPAEHRPTGQDGSHVAQDTNHRSANTEGTHS